jgi:hypothetical protein
VVREYMNGAFWERSSPVYRGKPGEPTEGEDKGSQGNGARGNEGIHRAAVETKKISASCRSYPRGVSTAGGMNQRSIVDLENLKRPAATKVEGLVEVTGTTQELTDFSGATSLLSWSKSHSLESILEALAGEVQQ